MEMPFTRFEGRLRQLHVSELSDVFDLFFPRFRTEHDMSSFITRGHGRALIGGVTLAGDSAAFTNRGRERRFAGDASLQRKRYYCLEDAPTSDFANNTLLNELFAYAEPRLPIEPEILDSTVDVEKVSRIAEALRWTLDPPFLLHIVQPRDSAWMFSPVLGLPPKGCFLRYPLSIVDVAVDRVIDLRHPSTLQWLFDTFVPMEIAGAGKYVAPNGEIIAVFKRTQPTNTEELLPTLLSQSLGGGTTFIQGIGAYLRAHGVDALIYPSARSDSRSIVRNEIVEESFGYILVDYRNAPPVDFEPQRYFGTLPAWRERKTKAIAVTITAVGNSMRQEVTNVTKLQQYRFRVFNDWTTNSLERARFELREGKTKLGDRVKLAIRRPSTIIGPEVEAILGSDTDFFNEEGGPATGFLAEWGAFGPDKSVARCVCSVLPAAQGESWEGRWSWDGTNWFLRRLCLRSSSPSSARRRAPGTFSRIQASLRPLK